MFCSVIEGVDQRISGARAERLAREHGDDPAVRLICDLLLVSPFHGDVGKALAYGHEARERNQTPTRTCRRSRPARMRWLYGCREFGSVRRLLEPRVRLDQPPYPKVSTLTLLGLIASDDGDARLGERYLREAVDYIEAIGAQTANEFTGIYGTLAETLRASESSPKLASTWTARWRRSRAAPARSGTRSR